MLQQWYIKADNERGFETVIIPKEEAFEYQSNGYVRTEAEVLAQSNPVGFAAFTKDELEAYALEHHNVDLDKRKTKANMIAEIEALEDGEG